MVLYLLLKPYPSLVRSAWRAAFLNPLCTLPLSKVFRELENVPSLLRPPFRL